MAARSRWPRSTGWARPIFNSHAPSPHVTPRCLKAGIPLTASPELREAAERAFAVLRGASETLCAQMPLKSRPPAFMVALHIWATSHGIASLFGRGDAARRALPISPEELLEAGVLVYLRGLGLPTATGADAI